MKTNLILPFLLFFLVLQISCKREISLDDQSAVQEYCTAENDIRLTSGEMVMGERLTNPYSLRIMQRALDSLLATKGMESEQLEPTDYYVRFRPVDSLEFVTLLDSDLELFDHPLDHEILIAGDYYHDPSIPEDEITWQYTVVHPSKIIQTVTHEMIARAEKQGQLVDVDMVCKNEMVVCAKLIDECYIPEHDVITKSGHHLPVSADELESLAISLSNLPEKYADPSGTKGLFSQGYCPRGQITVERKTDSTSIFEPLVGAKVRARYFLKWASSYTDDSGRYWIDTKFTSNPHLSVVFENLNDFVIWGNYAFLAPASHEMGQPDRSKEFEYSFKKGSTAWNWAVVNNAAYEYYKHCTDIGIKTPPSALKIWCVNAEWSSAPILRHLKGYKLASGGTTSTLFLAGCPALGGIAATVAALISWALPDVFIGTGSDYSYKDIESNVFHELGHASHFSVVGENVWGPYIEHIVTSWASGKDCYGDGKKNDDKQKICELGECWGYTSESLKYGALCGTGHWFGPAIRSLYNVINRDYVSKSEVFSCLKPNIKNIDMLHDALIQAVSDAGYRITDEFAKNGALSCQTVWVLKNETNSPIQIKYRRDRVYKVDTLSINENFILFSQATSQDNSRQIIGSILSQYDELIINGNIYSKPSALFRLKDSSIINDFSNSLCSIDNWSTINNYDEVGDKKLAIHTYDVKSDRKIFKK